MMQEGAMAKQSCAAMVLSEVSCCLLLLAVSSFVTAEPLESHDPQTALDRAAATACFVSFVGRGAGTPLSTCPQGMEQSGLLCYPRCRDNFHGVGPVCIESCSSGFRDAGALCINSYSKGCCCTRFGCCGCPTGYHDDGCVCRQSYPKKSYGRGVGVPLGCGLGKEQDGALCYTPCSEGYHRRDTLCWRNQGTSVRFPIKCNEYVWAVDEGTCGKVTAEFSAVAPEWCVGVALAATAMAAAVAVGDCSSSIGEAAAVATKLVQKTGAGACPLL